MKSLNDTGSGINPMANSGSERRNVITMIAIVTLGLMLRPSAALAKALRKSEGWRSDAAASSNEGHGAAISPVILPPPDEPPPPPPPSEDLLSEYSITPVLSGRDILARTSIVVQENTVIMVGRVILVTATRAFTANLGFTEVERAFTEVEASAAGIIAAELQAAARRKMDKH
jgi:hypothetical protein